MLNPPIVVPNTFVNGTIIDAGQMNANFSALLSWINTNGRIAIVGNLSLYVSPVGSDSNNGLSPTAPFKTITHAYDTLRDQYAFADQNAAATIVLAPGTYNETVILNGVIPAQQQPVQVQIIGNAGAPDTVTVTGDPSFTVNHGAMLQLNGVAITGPSDGIFVNHFSLLFWQNIDFGAVLNNHVFVKGPAKAAAIGDYSISGSAGHHGHSIGSGGNIYISNTELNPIHIPVTPGPNVTITGNPNFSAGFIAATQLGLVDLTNVNFIGAATGQRYLANDNGVIRTGTGGALVLPGTVAGVFSNGGIYD